MTKEFKTHEAAEVALKEAVRNGRCDGGYISERFNGGTPVYTVHCRKGGSGWAL